MRPGPKPRPQASPRLKAGGLPRCPAHLDPVAKREWRRLVRPLFEAGILTIADRAAFAAYCQAYSLWAEAVTKQRDTPKLLRTPSGYVQQSPWIGIANKQMELMGRFMVELGITPSARSRLADVLEAPDRRLPAVVQVMFRGPDGRDRDIGGKPIDGPARAIAPDGER